MTILINIFWYLSGSVVSFWGFGKQKQKTFFLTSTVHTRSGCLVMTPNGVFFLSLVPSEQAAKDSTRTTHM